MDEFSFAEFNSLGAAGELKSANSSSHSGLRAHAFWPWFRTLLIQYDRLSGDMFCLLFETRPAEHLCERSAEASLF